LIKNRKLLIFIVISFLTLLISIFIFRPISISNFFSPTGQIQISITKLGLENNGSPKIEQSQKEYDVNSQEYQQILDVLEKYKIHWSFSSITNETTVENVKYKFLFSNENRVIQICDNSKIIINNKVYKIGYFNSKIYNDLCDELKSITNIT